MRKDPLRVLVVTSDFDDLALLNEALQEIEERQFQSACIRRYLAVPASSAGHAAALLGSEPFDAVLVDLAVPGAAALVNSTRLPVILLASTADEALALNLVRQGVQDYIFKNEIDCMPLARSLRCSIERVRLLEGWRSLAALDQATGLYNAGPFASVAELLWNLGAELGVPVILLRGQMAIAGDLAMLRATDGLRLSFGEAGLVGRLDDSSFAAVKLSSANGRIERLEREVRERCEGLRFVIESRDASAGTLAEALCENKVQLAATCASP
jgi:CheY-like chemotaxis protein